MRPKYPRRMTWTTPGPSTTDPVSGNRVPGPSIVEEVSARISQRPVANVGAQLEIQAGQDTSVSFWTILMPYPDSASLTSKSTGVDDLGRKFAIEGDIADRPDHKPKFRAAAARLISDMQ